MFMKPHLPINPIHSTRGFLLTQARLYSVIPKPHGPLWCGHCEGLENRCNVNHVATLIHVSLRRLGMIEPIKSTAGVNALNAGYATQLKRIYAIQATDLTTRRRLLRRYLRNDECLCYCKTYRRN